MFLEYRFRIWFLEYLCTKVKLEPYLYILKIDGQQNPINFHLNA